MHPDDLSRAIGRADRIRGVAGAMISVRVGCEHLEVRPIGVDAIPAFAVK